MMFNIVYTCSDVYDYTYTYSERVNATSSDEAFSLALHRRDRVESWFPDNEGMSVDSIAVFAVNS